MSTSSTEDERTSEEASYSCQQNLRKQLWPINPNQGNIGSSTGHESLTQFWSFSKSGCPPELDTHLSVGFKNKKLDEGQRKPLAMSFAAAILNQLTWRLGGVKVTGALSDLILLIGVVWWPLSPADIR